MVFSTYVRQFQQRKNKCCRRELLARPRRAWNASAVIFYGPSNTGQIKIDSLMSALGHWRTSRHIKAMSALPQQADIKTELHYAGSRQTSRSRLSHCAERSDDQSIDIISRDIAAIGR
jgi:hypothetical protein